LGEIETVDSIRMVSIKDAAAMKINAICNRGSKKDFFDLQVLLKTFSLEEMLNFYQKKYAVGHRFMAIRSLVWFDDAVLKTTDITLLVKEEGKNRTLEKIIMPAKLTAMKEDEDEIIIADSAEYIATKKLLKFKGNIYMKKDERLVKCDELNYFTAIKGISSAEDKK
jgi:predicted nucleotidyltransferase component of viral defense system